MTIPQEPPSPLPPHWTTKKCLLFHTNSMLGTLDFTSSEHWAPSIFPTAQPCSGMLTNQHLPAPDLKREVKTQHKMASKQQAIDHARKYHIIMLFLCHPKMLHKHCFQFHFNSQDKLLWSGQLQQHFAKNQATAYTSHEVPLLEKYPICEFLRASVSKRG